MNHHLTRRRLIRAGLQMSAGAGLGLGLLACESGSDSTLVCADPAQMTSAEASVRRTLNYVEQSADPARVCSGCEFFSAAAGGCGTCEMFSGKAVNPGGHCDSWSVDA
jgi:hypothetical protein